MIITAFRHYEYLSDSTQIVIRALLRAVEVSGCEPRAREVRAAAFSLRLGREMNLNRRDLIALWRGGLLHDVGKMAIPDHVLHKRGLLTEGEWAVMREHVAYGIQFIGEMEELADARAIIAEHHERYDGRGYPAGLRGEAINPLARVLSVASAFAAMTGERHYRETLTYDQARLEIVSNSGKQFDPTVARAFLGVSGLEWEVIAKAASAYDRSSDALTDLIGGDPTGMIRNYTNGRPSYPWA